MPTNTTTLRVEKYRNTRFFAVYQGKSLLAVTVYKKGAKAVVSALESAEFINQPIAS